MARAIGTATHCPRGHERTPQNTYYGKQGRNTCRVCKREDYEAKRAQRAQAFADGVLRPTRRNGQRNSAAGKADPVQIAAFRAAHEAGVLDDLLMRRLRERMEAA